MVIEIIGIIAAIAVGYWQITRNKKNLIEAGAFERPEVEISFSIGKVHFEINSKKENPKQIFSLIYINSKPFRSREVFILDFNIHITNTGSKKIEGSKICLRFPPKGTHIIPDGSFNWIQIPPLTRINRRYSATKEGKFAVHEIEEIPIGFNIEIEEKLKYSPTRTRTKMDFKTKDNEIISKILNLNYRNYFDILFVVNEIDTFKARIYLEFCSTTNIDEFIKNYKEEYIYNEEKLLLKKNNKKELLKFMFTKWIFIETEKIKLEEWSYKEGSKNIYIPFLKPIGKIHSMVKVPKNEELVIYYVANFGKHVI